MGSEILQGWKSISTYLQRDERTVRRWEKQYGLPVRRLTADGRKSSVYAMASELDDWLREPRDRDSDSGSVAVASEPSPLESEPTSQEADQAPNSASSPWKRYVLAACLLILCAGSLLVVWHVQHVRALRSVTHAEGSEDLLEADVALEQRTYDSLTRAASLYEKHIQSNPKSVEAYAGLAKTYCLLREFGTMPSATAYAKAKESAEHALALDPDNSDAHAVLGFVDFFWSWNSTSAERHFQNAMILAPQSPLPRQWYGSMLMHEGKLDRALKQLDIAQRLAPSSVAIISNRALCISLLGDREHALGILSDVERYFPDAPAPHRAMAFISLQSPRDPKRFLRETARFAELRGDTLKSDEIRAAGKVYEAKGELAMWRYLLDEEKKRSNFDRPSLWVAELEAIIGEDDAAVKMTADLVRGQNEGGLAVPIDPALASLRSEGKLVNVLSFLPGH